LKTKDFPKRPFLQTPPKYGQIRTKMRTIAVRIYQAVRLSARYLSSKHKPTFLFFSIGVEKGYGDITPEVHAAVAGVAEDKGSGSRRLFWEETFREDPKPAGPALVLAGGRAPFIASLPAFLVPTTCLFLARKPC
jgi:hypothetical protein